MGNKHTITTPPNNGNYCFFNKESESVVCGDENTKTVDKISNKSAKSVVLGKETSNDGESNVAIGSKSKTSATATIAIGSSAMAKADQAIALGLEAEGNSQFDISIGRFAGNKASNTNGDGHNIAIGDGALKNGSEVNNNTVLGTSAAANLKGSHNIVMGAYANSEEAIKSAKTSGSKDTEINIKTRTVNNKSIEYVETNNSVAIGHRALSTKAAAVALGQQAKAFGYTSVSLGNSSRALGDNSAAMGNLANAGNSGAIAIGLRANFQAKDEKKNILQAYYKKTGANSVAIGVDTHAESTHSITMGTNATVKELHSSDFTADKITDKKGNTINKKDLGTYLTGNGSVSIGSDSLVRGTNAVAIGQAAETLGQNAFAGGNDSHANGKSAVAIGDGATALKDSSTAIGSYTKALEGGAGAFGYHAYALAFRSLALGAEAIASKGSSAIAIGDKAKSESQDAIAVGREAHAKVKDSIAIGQGVVTELLATDPATDQDGVIAIGSKGGPNTFTKAAGKAAIAIGRNSTAIGRGTVTLGDNSHSTKGQAISIGAAVKSSGAGSVAIGSTAESSGDHAVSLAVASKSTGHRSLAFGYQALATHNDSVALGAGAETAEVVKTNEATVNTFKYSGFAGTAPIATVSVGKAGKERTITNVAAGRIDKTSTDAINGSQLYLALNTLGYVGDTLVTNVLGGNAAIVKEGDNAGTLTMSNIGGTGADTIDAAIAAVKTQAAQKTQVVAGDNITVTQGGTAENPTYTVATKKDVKFDSVIAGGDEGGTKIDKDGLTFVDKDGNKITNTPSISKAGIDAGSQKVTNVQNGDVAKDSKEAVNGGQLFAQGEGVKNIIGGSTTYNPETGTYTNTDIGGTGAATIHDAIAKVKAQAAQKTQIVAGKNITVTNTGTAENPSYTVATKDEVEFDKTTVGSVVTDKNTNDITGLSNKTLGGDNFAKNGRAASEEQLNAAQSNLATLLGGDAKNTNGNVTMTNIGGTGKNNINDAIKASRNEVKAGKNMVVTPTQGANGQTIYEVATADNVEFKEVKVGPKVTINEAGLQAGNIKVDATTNKISGIAKGEVSATSTDAVNGSQLHELNQKFDQQNNMLGNRINKVDRNLRAGIAGANAAAGLPQAYLPGKSMVAAAVGTYKGESAIAVGMSRISDNGKVIIKLTGNTNSRGDFGASIGAGYQW
ncbi:YadA-like family protein [Pasteurella multocida]|uniref:YadA-like family protein n=1 Tax=Pasteurella multocida TaxID=747 RepID=UPI003979578A